MEIMRDVFGGQNTSGIWGVMNIEIDHVNCRKTVDEKHPSGQH